MKKTTEYVQFLHDRIVKIGNRNNIIQYIVFLAGFAKISCEY